MFEDGDFDGMEFSDYDLMHNAELDMDDTDREWEASINQGCHSPCFSI